MRFCCIVFALFFNLPSLAQFPVLQSYQYPTNEALDNMNCNVFYGGNNRLYASPYSNGLFEICNTGMRRIPAPVGSTVGNVESWSGNRLLLSSNAGIWISETNGRLNCLDSSESVYLKRNGISYYYIRVRNNREYELCVISLQEVITPIYKCKSPLTLHSLGNKLILQVSKPDSSLLFAIQSGDIIPFNIIKLTATNSLLVSLLDRHTYILCRLGLGNKVVYEFFKNGIRTEQIYSNSLNVQSRSAYLSKSPQGITKITRFDGSLSWNIQTSEIKAPCQFIDSASNASMFFPGQSTIVRTFQYLNQYPKLFNKDNSHKIFSLVESPNHILLAGSFQDGLMGICDTGYVSFDLPEQRITNGSFTMPGRAVVLPEGGPNTYFYVFEAKGKVSKIAFPVLTAFYMGYYSRNGRLYFGSAQKGLWYTDTSSFLSNRPDWKKIDSNQNDRLTNILTITEDTLGRIWYAHPQNGIGIYYPESSKTQYFLKSKNDIPYGAMASVTDHKGTVWLGTRPGGLVWYNAYTQAISPTDLHDIEHPLLKNTKEISALCLYRNYLIASAYDKILALNLDSFYAGKIYLKYLTQQETHFTSFTEQNTLIAASDGGIWFSTHDNLYRWDFNKWLQQSKDKINLIPILRLNSEKDTLQQKKTYSVEPTDNSFSIELFYYHPDLLPRYMRTALQYEKDTIIWSKVNTDPITKYSNLRPGQYSFHIQIMELDGSLTHSIYPIEIKNFWYKTGWFWFSFFGFVSIVILFIQKRFNNKKLAIAQLQVEKEITEKELVEVRSQQEKNLALLRLQNIANQIRPHFILNALNVIGAALPSKSKAEKLLNNLSMSLGTSFNQSLNNKNTHSLETEWMICLNTIEMYRNIYLPQLILTTDFLPENLSALEIPINLIQIPIENALLHGLRNSQLSTKELRISIKMNDESMQIQIEDNGIGRKAASEQSNARKNGTGLQNLTKTLAIYNLYNTTNILFNIEDCLPCGTIVRIQIPNNYLYDI